MMTDQKNTTAPGVPPGGGDQPDAGIPRDRHEWRCRSEVSDLPPQLGHPGALAASVVFFAFWASPYFFTLANAGLVANAAALSAIFAAAVAFAS